MVKWTIIWSLSIPQRAQPHSLRTCYSYDFDSWKGCKQFNLSSAWVSDGSLARQQNHFSMLDELASGPYKSTSCLGMQHFANFVEIKENVNSPVRFSLYRSNPSFWKYLIGIDQCGKPAERVQQTDQPLTLEAWYSLPIMWSLQREFNKLTSLWCSKLDTRYQYYMPPSFRVVIPIGRGWT